MSGIVHQADYPEANQVPAGQDGVPDECIVVEDSDQSELSVTRQAPWMAVAMLLHGVAFLIFAFIVTREALRPEQEVIRMAVDENVMPPLPEPEEKEAMELPKPEVPVTERQTEDPRISQDCPDETLEDPCDVPNDSFAPNPSEDDNDADSANPSKGPQSAVGLGPGTTGGKGRKGDTGGGRLRRPPGPSGKKDYDRTLAALQWLVDHQNPAGYWSAANYMDDSIRLPKGAKTTGSVDFKVGDQGKGWTSVDVGVTGLALLAFAGDGQTQKDGKFREAIKRGVKWVMSVQDAEGCFGKRQGEEYVYNHAICAMAVAELYAMSDDPVLKGPAQRAVDFIVASQNPGLGWRYDVKCGDNDSSVTAWMVLALKSADIAGLKFPKEQVYAGANRWYDKVTQTAKERGGNCTGEAAASGYNAPDVGCARLPEAEDFHDAPSMDACCVMVRIFTQHGKTTDRSVGLQAKRMLNQTPKWDQYYLDFYYWYYASLALFQMGDGMWKPWEKDLYHPTLFKYQRGYHARDVEQFGKDITCDDAGDRGGRWKLDEHGSWDPVDAWGVAGGRVYSTAINALTLEAYYRYNQISAKNKK